MTVCVCVCVCVCIHMWKCVTDHVIVFFTLVAVLCFSTLCGCSYVPKVLVRLHSVAVCCVCKCTVIGKFAYCSQLQQDSYMKILLFLSLPRHSICALLVCQM